MWETKFKMSTFFFFTVDNLFSLKNCLHHHNNLFGARFNFTLLWGGQQSQNVTFHFCWYFTRKTCQIFLDRLMLENHWLRKSNLLFSWSAWTTVQVSQCPSFGIFLRYIGKMDYLAPRVEKCCSWAFEANQRQIHVFYGVIVSGLTPGSWDWATYLSAKWSAEDQDSLDPPLLYRRYTAEK